MFRSSSDIALTAGFVLAVTGLWMIAGTGWALLVAGSILFLAGGLSGRSQKP